MYYIDPVCKKRVRKKSEYAILKFRGQVYHFCCSVCKESFERQPEKYALAEKEPEKEPESSFD